MTGISRSTHWLLVAAGGVTVAVVVAFLVALGGDESGSKLAATDVRGVWSADRGGRLTVRADGSAELERVMEPETGCGQADDEVNLTYTGPARWVIDTHPDEPEGLRFDYVGAGTGKKCSVYLSIVGSVDSGGVKGFLPHDPGPWYEMLGQG
ncbi:hypothetical protein [Streptomyces sp. NPDC094049]|uniref:hypothetical protein n=1 Tax=Streptomyces sp. NPDC094049 TaxID=3154987 RepID=UPI0033305940